MIKNLLIVFSVFFSFSCTKEEFSANKRVDPSFIPHADEFEASACTKFSLIKPKVDFLFVWDNSSSQLFINNSTKASLNNLITSVSDRFDYRVLSAPLFGPSGQPATGLTDAFIVTNNPEGLSSTALSKIVPKDLAPQALDNFTPYGGGDEKGISRSYELTNLALSNGIFRRGSYHIVVLMSNGNDTITLSGGRTNGPATTQYINDYFEEFKQLRDSYNGLRSLQLRFMSLVAYSDCNAKRGSSYISMSNKLYTSAPLFGTIPNDQATRNVPPDTYDICTASFFNLFDGINTSITQQLVKHRYDHWLIASPDSPLFDPSSIVVRKSNGAIIPESTSNGWEYLTNGSGNVFNVNSRFFPEPGEPITGHVIKLHGNAKITYPECLTIRTSAPTDYYDHVVMNANPNPSTITLKINGSVIPQSTSNGWELIGFRSSLNIKVGSTNPVYRTGYFLKLYGSAVYSNGASIVVDYLPAGN